MIGHILKLQVEYNNGKATINVLHFLICKEQMQDSSDIWILSILQHLIIAWLYELLIDLFGGLFLKIELLTSTATSTTSGHWHTRFCACFMQPRSTPINTQGILASQKPILSFVIPCNVTLNQILWTFIRTI